MHILNNYKVTAVRSSDLDDAEVRRRLGRAYRIILDYRAKKKTADRGEFSDPARTAADDEPTLQPVSQETL